MFHINIAERRITRLFDMAVVNLTETAISFIDHFILKSLQPEDLAIKFNISVDEVQADFEFIIKSLEKKGFGINKDNLLDISDFIEDLSAVWSPITPIVHIIQNCNSPCIMCDCWKVKQKNFHNSDVLKNLFYDLKNKGAVSIMLSGGEPLMHPDLETIIISLKDLDLGCELNTNGLLLHKNLWLLKYNIDEIVISMDATSAEGYKTIRGLNKFNLVWQNFDKIKTIKPEQNIGIRITVTKEILYNLEDSINFFLNKGVDYVGFSPLDTISSSFSRTSNNKDKSKYLTDKLLCENSHLKNLQKILCDKNSALSKYIDTNYRDKKISWSSLSFLSCINYYLSENSDYVNSQNMCIFPLSSLVLDYNGDLKNCFYSKPFGNIYEYTNIDWKSKASLADLINKSKCVSCRGKIFCG